MNDSQLSFLVQVFGSFTNLSLKRLNSIGTLKFHRNTKTLGVLVCSKTSVFDILVCSGTWFLTFGVPKNMVLGIWRAQEPRVLDKLVHQGCLTTTKFPYGIWCAQGQQSLDTLCLVQVFSVNAFFFSAGFFFAKKKSASTKQHIFDRCIQCISTDSKQKQYKSLRFHTFMDENKVKEAFSKVKEDMLSIKYSIDELKSQLLAKETHNKLLDLEIHHLKSILKQNQAKTQETTETPITNPIFLVSSGNKGVFRQTDNRQTTDIRHIFDTESNIEAIFISLTEKEFLIFLTLYQLEEELKKPLPYAQLANKLSISQSSIRDHISEIIRKKAPIIKIKTNNKKVLLSIDKTFKNLNIMSKILTLRHIQDSQTTLYNH